MAEVLHTCPSPTQGGAHTHSFPGQKLSLSDSPYLLQSPHPLFSLVPRFLCSLCPWEEMGPDSSVLHAVSRATILFLLWLSGGFLPS